MKKSKKLIKKLLDELERTPLIQIACEKIGISRNTFYRWIKEDEILFSQIEEAISLGKGFVNDIAVSNVLSGIKNKDAIYTKYWLDRNHPDFRRPYVLKIDPNDFIQYKRLTGEKEQYMRAENEARELANKPSEKELEEGIQKLKNFQSKWFVNEDEERQKAASKLFEEWKKDYLDGKST